MVTVNEERDNAQVIMQVGDLQITKGEVIEEYDAYLEMYASYYGVSIDQLADVAPEIVEEAIETVFDNYLQMLFVKQYAEQVGADISLTEEQKSELEEAIASNKEYYENMAQEEIDAQEGLTEEEKTEMYNDIVEEGLLNAGITDGSLEKGYTDGYMVANLKDFLGADYEPTDAEIEEYYNEELEEQQKVLDETPSAIVDYETVGEVSLYTPDGIRYVNVLHVQLNEEDVDAIAAERAAGNDEAADQKRDEALAMIEADLKEVMEMAEEDMDNAITNFGDAYTTSAVEAEEEGVRIYEGISYYDEAVIDAAMELEVGELSEAIATDKGYYIVELVSVAQQGAVALEDVKEALVEKMIDENKEEKYTLAYADWQDENTIIKHPELMY